MMSRKIIAKNILVFFIALLTAWLWYASPFTFLCILTIATGQFILDISPVPLITYIESDLFLFSNVILAFIIAIVLNYYHRQYSWWIIWGLGFCFMAITFIVFLIFLLAGWYISVDFINMFLINKALEEISLATPLHFSFYSIFWIIIWGGIGIILLKAWRILIVALITIVSIILFIVVWANMNNVTSYCFVNGYWENSPVHKKIVGYLDNSDDVDKIYPGIIYISHLYLSGTLMQGDACYTSDDKMRYALLKKYIFYYPDFPETIPKLQDMITEKAEDNDVPAMLLLAYMYNQGQGVKADKTQGEIWWSKVLSSSSDDWVLKEKAFIFGE